MCKAIEDWGNTWAAEKVAEKSVEVARILLKQNMLPLDKIAEASGLSIDAVKSISEKIEINN